MLRVCTLQDVDDEYNAEGFDMSFLSVLNINYGQVKWKNVAVMIALHVGALVGWGLFLLGYVCWQTALWNFLFGLASIVGVTMGALSLWSDRLFDTKLPLKQFLMIAQTIASQDRIWTWVRDHRQHCKHKNTNADPFNSKRGFFFSHMGWFMMKKHPSVITEGKKTDMSDLEVDPLVMFQKRYYVTLYLLLAVLQLAIPCYVWDEVSEICFLAFIARVVAVLHITWCIHSLHDFGETKLNKEEMKDDTKCVERKCVRERPCWFDPTSILLCICGKRKLTSCSKKAD